MDQIITSSRNELTNFLPSESTWQESAPTALKKQYSTNVPVPSRKPEMIKPKQVLEEQEMVNKLEPEISIDGCDTESDEEENKLYS